MMAREFFTSPCLPRGFPNEARHSRWSRSNVSRLFVIDAVVKLLACLSYIVTMHTMSDGRA